MRSGAGSRITPAVDRPGYAFLAHGRLFVAAPGEDPREIESRFADEYKARVRKIRKKQAWKEQGAGARFMRGGALWGDDMDLEAVPVAFTGLAPGHAPNTLLYSVSTGVVGGVFQLDLATGEEKRLFHSADHRIEQLATSPDHEVVACTLRGKGGTSSVAVMAADGSEVFEVTDGDVIDLAPSWLPKAALKEEERRHQLVFQSAGVGRDAGGVFVAVGPASVAILDAEHGELQVLREDPKRDFLAPRMDEDRTLYCVRRPYQDVEETKPGAVVLDALLFPFRLLGAVFGWLNFFTLRYSGKPLLRAGSARSRSADLRQMMMMGNLAGARDDAEREAEKAAREAVRDWELVALREDGAEEVVAKRVRAYDLAGEGRVLFTNGVEIELRDSDGSTTTLTKKPGISELCALRG